ncbi:MAG TPA: NAD(P)-dependent oxidoreductase [Hyphomicrobiaceae bacterium]|nr:NAD(P)-dependent oxidoreductase [Hyphomicrobiaceae bacterium]
MVLLVTGAMGHVGYEVARQAAARGRSVVAQYRGTFREGDAQATEGKVAWVRLDLANAAALRTTIENQGIDACIHCAAVPNENLARPDPFSAVAANTAAVATLLEAARTGGWQRFVYVSTGSVFQNATDMTPILEDAQPSVASVYSTTKYCGELLVAMYRSQFGLSAATVRVSWVYGPPLVPRVRDNPRGPIPYFLKCALSGVAVREQSGAEFAASFTHVSDVAAGLLAAVEARELTHPVYHLGSGRNFTTAAVARAVKAAVREADIEVGPGTAPWTDHTRMRGPLAGRRLLQDTGFEPHLGLEAGIASFADWMRANWERWQ